MKNVIILLMKNEMKFVLRISRARVMLLFSLFLWAQYYFSSFHTSSYKMMITPVYLSLLSIIHSQLLYSWDSSFFSFMLTKVSREAYIKSKYYFHCFLLLISSSIVIVMDSVKQEPIIFQTVAIAVYFLGTLPYVILLLGRFNKKPVDINKGAFMNYEGFTIMPFLLVLYLLFSIAIFYYPINYFWSESIAFYVFFALGCIGFLFRNSILKLIIIDFNFVGKNLFENYLKK